ncbi:MAG: hypothetical protein ABI340_08925 [Nitrososphaera sp.]|jgi:hypothetical protein
MPYIVRARTNLRCKGICYRYAAKKPSGRFRFAIGQRPCSVCGIFIDSLQNELVRCPCCNNKLRLTSRNARSRKNRFGISDSKVLERAVNVVRTINNAISYNENKGTLALNK